MWNLAFDQIHIPLSLMGINEIIYSQSIVKGRPWPIIMILILKK